MFNDCSSGDNLIELAEKNSSYTKSSDKKLMYKFCDFRGSTVPFLLGMTYWGMEDLVFLMQASIQATKRGRAFFRYEREDACIVLSTQ